MATIEQAYNAWATRKANASGGIENAETGVAPEETWRLAATGTDTEVPDLLHVARVIGEFFIIESLAASDGPLDIVQLVGGAFAEGFMTARMLGLLERTEVVSQS